MGLLCYTISHKAINERLVFVMGCLIHLIFFPFGLFAFLFRLFFRAVGGVVRGLLSLLFLMVIGILIARIF